MARSYSKTYLAIWTGDFRDLTRGEQHLYWLLNSSPKLSSAGMVPIQVRKWASQSADATVAELEADLAGLVAKRYVLVDNDTEEALIRTFIRHDQGYRNKFLRKSIESAIPNIESPTLREHARLELAACMEEKDGEHQVEDSEQDSYEDSSEDSYQGTTEEAYEANYTFQPQPHLATSPSSSNVVALVPADETTPDPSPDDDGLINKIITHCGTILADKRADKQASSTGYAKSCIEQMQREERPAIAALLAAKPYLRTRPDKAADWYMRHVRPHAPATPRSA